ncbi:MAG: LamG-like jellyroll fold domain-containing protein [Streptosporangiaceae bacterium]
MISSITTPEGLAQDFTSSSGEVTSVADATSGRALSITWSTPSGAANPHVASVSTGPPASGQSGLTWTYGYSGDELTQVCAPGGSCTSYTNGATVSHYDTAVLDSGPRSYYTFADPAGATTASDDVDVNLGATNGTYSGVTLGGAGPVSGSADTSASFNGKSSYATLAPNLIADSTYLTLGLWFKASSGSSGVLYGYQQDPMSDSSGGHYTPALYIGTDGKLRGQFWTGTQNPITSSSSVADGKWHYAVLVGEGSSQALYLDGVKVGSLSGTITQGVQQNTDIAGAGFWNGWPEYSSSNLKGYFSGSIADVAVYPTPLGAKVVTQQYALAGQASPELTQVALPSGAVYEQASYNASADRVATYTDPDGGQWTIHLPSDSGYKPSAESLGQVTRSVTVTDPDGNDEVYRYDAINGDRLISYDPGAGTGARTFGYDSAGFLNQVTDQDGNSVRMTNDAFGNMLTRSWADVTGCDPTGLCTMYYSYYEDAGNPLDPRNGELTAVRDGRSPSDTDNTYLTSYGYNSSGLLTSVTTPPATGFPNGRTTTCAYSSGSSAAYGGGSIPAGLPTSVTTPGGAQTSYNYYSDGDLAQVSGPTGRRTVLTYDLLGRALTSTDYTTSDPGGLVTSYSYNGLGQPLTVTYPGVTNIVTNVVHTLEDSYTYDADGDLTQLTQSDLTGGDPSRTTSYTYDGLGQVATVTDPSGATTAYDYDPSGNVTTMINADGDEYDYTYNAFNEVTQVTLNTESTSQANPDGGATQVLQSDAYDPAGLLASTTDAMGRITNYAYDPGQELIAVTQTDPSTSPTTGRRTTYSYDSAGNLVSKSVNGQSGGLITASSVTNYTVNADGQVTGAVLDPSGADRTTSYTYDADGNVTGETAAGPGGSTTATLAYDALGDVTSQTIGNGSTSQTTTWTYDHRGLPLTQTDPRGNASGASPASYTTSYAYNEAGQLDSVTGPPVMVQTYAAQTSAQTHAATTYGYDTYGDLTRQDDPDANLTTAGYDGDGRITSLTEPSYTPPGLSSPVTATRS